MDIFGVPLCELAEIGQVVSGVGAIFVVISIFLVWKQVRQQTRDSRVELTTGMTNLISSVSQTFIEYPHMRKYFYGGEEPTDEDAELAQAIAARMAKLREQLAVD